MEAYTNGCEHVNFDIGVKSDPIEYRFSYEWLFDIMMQEDLSYLQLGSFLELFFLSDDYFYKLREEAEKRKIRIVSLFTSHRELGGFMNENEEFKRITKRNYRRLIQIAEILGASSAGSSMGGVLRDRLNYRQEGIHSYLEGMRELMHYAKERGLEWLTTEPMSSYAEPPCNSTELVEIGSALSEYHEKYPDETVRFGFCADISHGWADEKGEVLENNEDYFVAAIPFLHEFHFTNTDRIYNETFGFEPENIDRGIVDVGRVHAILENNRSRLPHQNVIGYLELPGPKMGRDYSDRHLGRMLRDSLKYIKKNYNASAGD
jgi:ribulose-phosphate 3-epimerase